MTNLTPKAEKLARRLRSEYRQIRSWRKLTDLYGNPIIKPRTLHRIATSKKIEGEQWYPRRPDLLLALGLIKPRKPRTVKPLDERTHEELIDMRHRLVLKLEQVDALLIERRAA